MMVLQYPDFLYPLLKNSMIGVYGHSRIDPVELVHRELDGSITSQDGADQRLPGSFSFLSYLQHMATPNTWGDEIALTLMSMMLCMVKVCYKRSFATIGPWTLQTWW